MNHPANEYLPANEFLEVARRAAEAGGAVLQDWLGRVRVREKGPKDLVTEADLESQRTIQEIIHKSFPDHDFLGEEDGPQVTGPQAGGGRSPSGYCWIVDPLDGTTNFAHGLPSYCVSIALRHESELLLGVIYDPTMKERFEAVSGGGATLNGQAIQTSSCLDLPSALIAASFPAQVPRGSIEVARFVEVLHGCRALRRMGSAALNLAYVAAGRLDGYWATSVKIWDVAAGVLLVREAGGVVTGVDGQAFRLENPNFAAASTLRLHQELRSALERAAPLNPEP